MRMNSMKPSVWPECFDYDCPQAGLLLCIDEWIGKDKVVNHHAEKIGIVGFLQTMPIFFQGIKSLSEDAFGAFPFFYGKNMLLYNKMCMI